MNLQEKTLGILSSWNENCGNASYTKQLIEELSKHFKKVDPIPLDQNLIYKGESIEKEILQQVKEYDFINIQYEPGLFGQNFKKAHKLIKKIIDAHDRITITIHSLILYDNINTKSKYAELILDIKEKLRKLRLLKNQCSSASYFYTKFLFFIKKKIAAGKKIEFIVHRTQLEYHIKKFTIPVRNHPIVSASNRDILELNQPKTKITLLKKYNLDESKIYLGIFGFIGAYKGFELVLDALALLPEQYHLIMCCQKHPMTNYRPDRVNQEERELLKNKIYKKNGGFREFQADNQTKLFNSIILEKKLINRVHYINHLTDEEEFKLVIAGVDIPIFPYYEVGQGGSGPISYALHLNYGGKIIASRTRAFEEYYTDYYPGCLTFFDQGNYLELSQKILTINSMRDNILKAQQKYGVDTNIKTYLEATMALT